MGAAKKYLRSDIQAYPNYAVIPVMELRRFSTLFLISFGSEAARTVMRSELIASCDRVIRVSPDLTKRIRGVLTQLESLPKEQLEAALDDPGTLAEFALATANDPAIVTASNGAAFIDIIRRTGQKDQELRHLEEERLLMEKHEGELNKERQRIDEGDRQIEKLTLDLFQTSAETAKTKTLLEMQTDLNVEIVAGQIADRVNIYWIGVVGLAAALCIGLWADMIFHFTERDTSLFVFVSITLGLGVFYHGVLTVLPNLGPDRFRIFLTKRVAARRLARFSQSDVVDRVRSKLNLDSA